LAEFDFDQSFFWLNYDTNEIYLYDNQVIVNTNENDESLFLPQKKPFSAIFFLFKIELRFDGIKCLVFNKSSCWTIVRKYLKEIKKGSFILI